MYQSILLAVDGSEHSTRAAKHAAEIASLIPGSEVTILYVASHKDLPNETLHGAAPMELEMNHQKRISTAEKVLEDKEVYYKVEKIFGRPGPTILEFVNEGKYDLLVLGSRGLNPMQKTVLGSVSQKLANQADCPVLIIK